MESPRKFIVGGNWKCNGTVVRAEPAVSLPFWLMFRSFVYRYSDTTAATGTEELQRRSRTQRSEHQTRTPAQVMKPFAGSRQQLNVVSRAVSLAIEPSGKRNPGDPTWSTYLLGSTSPVACSFVGVRDTLISSPSLPFASAFDFSRRLLGPDMYVSGMFHLRCCIIPRRPCSRASRKKRTAPETTA